MAGMRAMGPYEWRPRALADGYYARCGIHERGKTTWLRFDWHDGCSSDASAMKLTRPCKKSDEDEGMV